MLKQEFCIDDLKTVPETADLWRMSRASIYDHLNAGNFKSVLLKKTPRAKSGRRMILQSSVDEWFRKQIETAGAL